MDASPFVGTWRLVSMVTRGAAVDIDTSLTVRFEGQALASIAVVGSAIQRAAAISASDDASVLWLPLDAPLVMPNRIDFNNWETDEWAWNGFLASMPVNHYSHTNFATSQRGPLRLRYRLLNPAGFPDRAAVIRAALPLEALGWR